MHGASCPKEWMTNAFEKAGRYKANAKYAQLWQQDNHPIELWSPGVIEQKVDYVHQNPVAAGLVYEPWYWKYSSAIDYNGGTGVLEIDFIG